VTRPEAKPRPKLRLVKPTGINKLTGQLIHEPVEDNSEWDAELDEAVAEIKAEARKRNG
jgi:hypothetical protein